MRVLFGHSELESAVGYLRASAENKQENSVEIQQDSVSEFCVANGLRLRGFEYDDGVSGLTADRPGFKRLFDNWIRNPTAPDFKYIVVLDVSRWGRFQNTEEGAALEYEAKRCGKEVIYIEEGDLSQVNHELNVALIRPIKRYLAADYSRQLSGKVFAGSVKVSEQGYSAGGMASYGLVRVLLDEARQPIGRLQSGQHKVIANQRVTFEPTGDEDTATVQHMFTMALQRRSPKVIAEELNGKSIPAPAGGRWTQGKVIHVLSNGAYAGMRVYNKTWGRLKQPRHANPRGEWVVRAHAFDSVVDEATFAQVQENLYWLIPSRWQYGRRLISRTRRLINGEMVDFLEQHGFDDDARWRVLHDMPIVYAVGFRHNDTRLWCFRITPLMRRYREVLTIGLDGDRPEDDVALLLLPTSEFGVADFMLVDEASSTYDQYKLQPNDLEQRLLGLSRVVAQT